MAEPTPLVARKVFARRHVVVGVAPELFCAGLNRPGGARFILEDPWPDVAPQLQAMPVGENRGMNGRG